MIWIYRLILIWFFIIYCVILREDWFVKDVGMVGIVILCNILVVILNFLLDL